MRRMSIIGLFLFSLVLLYNAKARMGVDLIKGEKHTPQILQDVTHGLIRCSWFANPHHCDK